MLNADLKEFEFISDFDELVISAVLAVPSGEVNGIVQIVHGMNEHKERYYPFMDYLAEQGFITVIHDNRGHGKSIVEADDLGFMFRNGGEGFISDIAQFNKRIREAYPGVPVFMIAIGMGAAGARCFLKEHDSDLDGIVLLGTVCHSSFSPVARTISSVSAKRPGSRFRSEKIFNAVDDGFGQFFEDPINSWRCSDADAVLAFNEDPLCNFKPTLNCYEELIWLVKQSCSSRGWKVTNTTLPIRFISGKEDPAMISEKKFMRSVNRLEKMGYESISHRLFDGMRHDVLMEKNSINVYKDIAKTLFSWLDRWNDKHSAAAAAEPPAETQPEEAVQE
ncbi:alpha/beta fold hydrolase [Ruminococcus sp.]|uniref:alpha/beta fold hydrolase n=1 Tax=Ruminococcus sp. TaxID=41978 RepID=UPI0025F0FD80|nr:alpha/beta fold hydrolase [Ruminococcus sp.]